MKNGFTLIELLIVITMVLFLTAIIGTTFNRATQKAQKMSCANNMHIIVQALQLYIEDFKTNPSYSDAQDLYGKLYYPTTEGRMGGITNLGVFVCPATRHKSPNKTGFRARLAIDANNTNHGWHNPNFSGSSIDYWVVKQKHPTNDTYINPDFMNCPKSNVILYECSDVVHGKHHPDGRNVGFWSGKVKFIDSWDPNKYPRNIDSTGKYESDTLSGDPTVANRDRHVYPSS